MGIYEFHTEGAAKGCAVVQSSSYPIKCT